MGLIQSIDDGYFSLVVEFSPHAAANVKHIASLGPGLLALNEKFAEHKIRIVGISLTQNPGGSLTYDHHATLAILREEGWPAELEVVPHVTGKDMNVDAISTLLTALAERGVATVLALTGDIPAGKGVFDVEALGLLQLVKDINVRLLAGARGLEALEAAPQLTAGAAVSPFKYTEGSLAMQYIKAAKKVREGAAFLVCQSGWDADRSEKLLEAMRDEGAPIMGNCLVAMKMAAKAMQSLPGCVVTDAFIEKLHGETLDDALTRAGQQLAMFRALGYAGADVGKPGEFQSIDEIEKIVQTAVEIEDWREHKANLTFPPPESPAPVAAGSAGISRAMHNLVFEKRGALHGVTKAVLRPFNSSADRDGALYHLFRALEGWGKETLYHCQDCGDCFLPENDYICTLGHCEKGFSNPPCGDADPAGRCGNNENRICVGERIYHRMLSKGALEEFKNAVYPPRKAALRNTSSLLNYFFERDHTSRPNPLEGSGLIQIGELLHASIPAPGAAMKYLLKQGPDAFAKPNRGRAVIESLIRSQAAQGAAYLDINIDALSDPEAPATMRRYVRLVHQYGGGVPPCIDSSSPDVLLAGLEEWRDLGDDLRPPLMNSVPFNEIDQRDAILALRKNFKFSIICLLVGPEGPLKSAAEMVDAARKLHARAKAAGFANDELFFDCVTLGIATDGCMDAMGTLKSSHVHNSFNAIKLIRADEEMKGVHAALGVSNWVYGAKKRSIGHVRAFVAAAKAYGLDAAITDTRHQFGVKPAAPELVEFVEMFASLDGDEDSMLTYSAKMQQARAAQWI